MERTSHLSCPSFWKLLMEEDFNRGIQIPHSFSSQLERRNTPCNYSIIAEDRKGSSYRSWRVKLVKKDHYFYLCKKSWPEFVRYHNLENGEVLLFHLVDKTTFRVTPYCANGSIKKLHDDVSPSKSKSEEDEDVRAPMSKKARKVKEESDAHEDDDDEPRETPRRAGRQHGKVYGGCNRAVDDNSRKEIEKVKTADEALKWDHYYDLGAAKPYFIRTIKSGHMYTLVVPRPFALAMELDKVKEVELKWEDDVLKRSWIAKINLAGKGRIDVGWRDFRRRFHIGVGQTCRFAVTDSGQDLITISVHVFPSGDHKSRN